jgi:hypothetical protein
VSGRYTATQREREAVPGAEYVYDVFRDGEHVAVFQHSFRGDEPVLMIDAGGWEQLDVSIFRGDILGLEVSAEGEAILDRLTGLAR